MGNFFKIFGKFLPMGISLIIILLSLISSLSDSLHEQDPTIFLKDLGTKIFAIDYNLYQTYEDYLVEGKMSFFNFLEILSKLYVFIFIYMKYTIILIGKITGRGGSVLGETLIGLLLLGVIEFASVILIEGVVFIPYKGVALILYNIVPMSRTITFFESSSNSTVNTFINNTVSAEYKSLI